MEISQKRFDELLDKELKLNALECGGVDNWEFYDISLEGYWEEKNRQEKIAIFSDTICEIMSEYGDEPAGHGAGYGLKAEGQEQVIQAITNFVKDYHKES
jgi:hypothetical protein